MNPILKKMNFKDQKHILVLFAPESFHSEMTDMEGYCEVQTKLKAEGQYDYVLAFAESVEKLTDAMNSLNGRLTAEDPQLWIAYPKKSSKKYKSDITRDHGWEAVGEQGFEPVKQIAIDADWSALRFRQVRFIKSLKRNPKMIISEEGKKRLK